MRRHHTGSGRRRAVPESWGRDHAPVAATTRNAVVSLFGPTPHTSTEPAEWDGWSPSTRVTTPDPGAAYADHISARIQALIGRSDRAIETAEESVTVADYLVQVDLDQPVEDGHHVLVHTCVGDEQLVERRLYVAHAALGSDRASRDLFCTLTT